MMCRTVMTKPEATFEPVSYSDLAGWETDDHAAAFSAFRNSMHLQAAGRAGAARGMVPAVVTAASAKAFFEETFVPHRVVHGAGEGMLTGYYEPVIEGSRTPAARFQIPIYRRPPDLVNLVEEAERGAKAHQLTHARQTLNGTEPYFTRREIESGALAGHELELLFFEDPVDVFFMQVQGSGCVVLPDGSEIRVTYDGKNGYPYTSIGRYIIDEGLVPSGDMSLARLHDWLRADRERGRDVMWRNASYIFFREIPAGEAKAPIGVRDIPLSTGRSLAVDTGYHAIGAPVYVTAPTLAHAPGPGGFHRLMIAQDVGSAIVGPERGDIYFGSGPEAGALAGVTKHPGNFFVLLPRT